MYELKTVCIPASTVRKSTEVESREGRVAKLRLGSKTQQRWSMGIEIQFQDCLFLSSNVFRKICHCSCLCNTSNVVTTSAPYHLLFQNGPMPNSQYVSISIGVSVLVQSILVVAGYAPLQTGKGKQDNHFSFFVFFCFSTA